MSERETQMNQAYTSPAYAEPTPAREMSVNECAEAVQVAAVEAAKASGAFIEARKTWLEARERLDGAWSGYMAARDRSDLNR